LLIVLKIVSPSTKKKIEYNEKIHKTRSEEDKLRALMTNTNALLVLLPTKLVTCKYHS